MNKLLLFLIKLLIPTLLIAQSNYATKVYDFLPAPGQFVNTVWAADTSSGEYVIGSSSSGVTLGGWGGYIILGFDKAIVDNDYNPYGIDFSVTGNAFSGWGEPAAVQVMTDENGNGLPDDTWYELAGSEYYFSTTIKNVEMTYYNPKYNTRYDIPYSTNKGFNGVMRTNSYHTQSYYPDPYNFDINGDSITYKGNYISFCLDKSNPSYIDAVRLPAFGYADVISKNSTPTVPRNAYDGFDLKWAVDDEGNSIELDSVNFIKVYAASQEDGGWLGEVSPEIFSATITEPDSTFEQTDSELNIIGGGQLQVLKGSQTQFEGILFKNGIPENNISPVWTSSYDTVATIDSDGLLTALENGETTIYFTGKDGVTQASQTVEIVELEQVSILLEGYSSTLSNDSLSVVEGETIYIHAECIDNRTGSRNHYTYENYDWQSSDCEIGTVDNGIFNAKKSGVTIVKAISQTNPSLSDSIVVVVSSIPEVEPASTPIDIDIANSSTTFTNDELFSTGTDAIVYIKSYEYTTGQHITNINLKNNQLTVEIDQADWGTQTVDFVVEAYGIENTLTLTFEISQPDELKNLVFVNGGQFMDYSHPTQLLSYTPYNNKTDTLDNYIAGATSVQDMIVDGNFAYVSADYYITRYDLVDGIATDSIHTQDLTDTADASGTDGAGVNNKMVIWKNLLLVTRQASSTEPEDGYNIRVYNKADLTLITKIPVSDQATDIVTVNDTAYAIINGGFSGTTSSLAVIDLKTLSLVRETDLEEEGLGVMQMLVKNNKIYCIRLTDYLNRFSSGVVIYDIATGTIEKYEYSANISYDSSPLGIAPFTGDTLFVKKDLGYVAFNTETYEFGSDILFPIPERITQSSDYGGKGSYYDSTEQRYYIAYNYWHGENGAGQIYDNNFDSVGYFEGVGASPEAVQMCYQINDNKSPYVYKGNKSESINAGEDFSFEVPNNIFRDADEGLVSPLMHDPLQFDWLQYDPTTRIMSGNCTEQLDSTTTYEILLQGFDESGEYATNIFSLEVVTDNAPIVSNPIADITEHYYAENMLLDLSSVFTDPDSDDEAIAISIVSNSNSSIVEASLSTDTLELDFISVGNSKLILQAESDGQYAYDTVLISVTDDESPVVANPIADISVPQNSADTIISLANVFSDPDDDNELITKSILNNRNDTLVSANINGNSLTLSFASNAVGESEIIVEALSNGKAVTDTFTVSVTTTSLSEINDIMFAETIFYPNPSSGIFRIQTQTTGNLNVKIYNILGNLVYTNNDYCNLKEIDISALPSGRYLVKLTHKTGHITKSIIKK